MVYWRDIGKKYIHGILNDTLKEYDMVYQQYVKRNIKKLKDILKVC